MQETACINNCTTAPGLVIGSSDPTKVKIANTFFFKVNGRSMYKTSAEVSLVGAVRNLPTLNGADQVAGNLAFDDGTVDASTNSCRMYTIVATSAETEAGTVTLLAKAGEDFPKHRQVLAGDICRVTKNNSVEVGYVYVKNETSAAFVPGTTHLDAGAGLTVTYKDNYAQNGL